MKVYMVQRSTAIIILCNRAQVETNVNRVQQGTNKHTVELCLIEDNSQIGLGWVRLHTSCTVSTSAVISTHRLNQPPSIIIVNLCKYNAEVEYNDRHASVHECVC